MNSRSKLHDVENQRATKLALLERNVDVGLVFLMYDALQTVKLQLKSASAVIGVFFDVFQNFFFSLQYSFGPITATIVRLRFEGTMISEMLYH